MSNSHVSALVLENVTRIYQQGERELHVFDRLELTIEPGEVVALVGPSGAGKSSLLHIAGLLEAPDDGSITIAGTNCDTLSDEQKTAVRRHQVGFVYQFHNLLPEFSALENVVLPQMIAGRSRKAAEVEAQRLLESFGLADRVSHRPAELSGGEQQRVAISRALANNPRLLLADEPTGNLDPKTAKAVFHELVEVTRNEGAAALIATHNLDLASRMDRVVLMHEGRLVDGAALASEYKNL